MTTYEKLELAVRGMTCDSCATHVGRALESIDGVQEVNVPGWQSARAVITAEAGVSEAELVRAVQEAGYAATVKTRRTLGEVDSIAGDGYDFDILIIGAGSGGFAAAIKGVELGARVALVNDGLLGGTCVNVGCVPSKALIRAAEAWRNAGRHPFDGVSTQQVALDWRAVRAQKDALVTGLRREKYTDVLAAYPEITFIPGRARCHEDGLVQVGERVIRARKAIITTGAQPRMLPIPGAEETDVLDSTTLMELSDLPASLIILGGRAIALELGQTMARFGVQVTLLQRSARLIPEHEPEISRALKNYLQEEGIAVVTGVQVERIEQVGKQKMVSVRVMGRPMTFRAEQVMMALGRQPNTRGLNLEALGVELNPSRAIIVDNQMRTTHPDIYAAGDVTTNPKFVYVAAAGGSIAAENAFTGAGKALDLSAMPGVIFTDPAVATVGLTESQARDAGYELETSTLPLHYVPRAIAARDTRGLVKLVAEKGTGRLLGAHILAADAGEVVQTAVLAVKFGLTLDDLSGTLFPYLTQVEGLKLAAQTFSKDPAMLSCCAG